MQKKTLKQNAFFALILLALALVGCSGPTYSSETVSKDTVSITKYNNSMFIRHLVRYTGRSSVFNGSDSCCAVVFNSSGNLSDAGYKVANQTYFNIIPTKTNYQLFILRWRNLATNEDVQTLYNDKGEIFVQIIADPHNNQEQWQWHNPETGFIDSVSFYSNYKLDSTVGISTELVY